jgi:hypothetical protein
MTATKIMVVAGISNVVRVSPRAFQDVNVLGSDYMSWSRAKIVVDYEKSVGGVHFEPRITAD